MHIICPHCHSPVELLELPAAPVEIVCASCGSSFRLDRGSTTAWTPREDHRQLGQFEVLAAVGSGVFGTVYKARDPELHRVVALKVPRAGDLRLALLWAAEVIR